MVRPTSSSHPHSPDNMLPPASPPMRAHPPSNAGNTCYLNAVLVALFADFDAWDGLLSSQDDTVSPSKSIPHSGPVSKNRSFFSSAYSSTSSSASSSASSSSSSSAVDNYLRRALRKYVTALRRGDGVSVSDVSAIRNTLIRNNNWPSGSSQQDAAEFFAALLDALDAPFVPLINHLHHAGRPDTAADHTPFTERLLWLTPPQSPPPTPSNLHSLVNAYFYGDVLHGLRRPGTPSSTITAAVSRTLIPSYTPVRETGETVPALRSRFSLLTVPFAIRRFSPCGSQKTRTPITVPMVIPATRYVTPFANGYQHTLILRSVVCHLGATLRSGHYVTYTYTPSNGWRRWDDLEPHAAAPAVKGDVRTGAPEKAKWSDEMQRNCYMLFYELVPGDGDGQHHAHLYDSTITRQMLLDAKLAAQTQVEEDHAMALEQHFLTNGRDDWHSTSDSQRPHVMGGGTYEDFDSYDMPSDSTSFAPEAAMPSWHSMSQQSLPPRPSSGRVMRSHGDDGRNDVTSRQYRRRHSHTVDESATPYGSTKRSSDAFADIRDALPSLSGSDTPPSHSRSSSSGSDVDLFDDRVADDFDTDTIVDERDHNAMHFIPPWKRDVHQEYLSPTTGSTTPSSHLSNMEDEHGRRRQSQYSSTRAHEDGDSDTSSSWRWENSHTCHRTELHRNGSEHHRQHHRRKHRHRHTRSHSHTHHRYRHERTCYRSTER